MMSCMKQEQVRQRKKRIGIIIGFLSIGILSSCQPQTKQVTACPMETVRPAEGMYIVSDLAQKRITYDELQEQMLQEILRQYDSYADANPDYVGWLYLADTKVNGPVVQSQLDGNGYWEYLYKDFYGNDKFAGTLFLDKACSIDSPTTDNWMIYGHNMNDGSMFGTLKYYRDELFWREHPTFTFTTRESVETFEILGVVQSWVSEEPQGQFEYFFFFDAENEEEFQDFVRQVKENSLYDTGVEVEYGDQLITLSTCDSWHEEGRLAIIGRRKKGL